jgi:hypothetical protein
MFQRDNIVLRSGGLPYVLAPGILKTPDQNGHREIRGAESVLTTEPITAFESGESVGQDKTLRQLSHRY